MKPMLLCESVITYKPWETETQLAMFDRDFSGCIVLRFSQSMNPDHPGTVTLDGQAVPYTLAVMPFTEHHLALAIHLIERCNEYGAVHRLNISGFVSAEGEAMEPAALTIKVDTPAPADPRYAAHEAVALQAAEDGIVLLKNEQHALPLRPGVMNVAGNALHAFRMTVVGAGKINPRRIISFKDAIRSEHAYTLNETLADAFRSDRLAVTDEAMAEAAAKSDTAIAIFTRLGGENTDNGSGEGEYQLSAEEKKLLHQCRAAFRKVVVVLNTPYPMDTTFVETCGVDALVWCGCGGMFAGQALMNVLTGRVNPSGKLTDTWAKRYEDLPSASNFYDCAHDGPRWPADVDVWVDTVYHEDLLMGYRHFDTKQVKPAYCFGFGLSYTSFAMETISAEFNEAEGLRCRVRVCNTGSMAGREVVQLYVGKPVNRPGQPARELLGFEKTCLLRPGEEEVLALTVPTSHLGFYDEARAAWVLPAGTYTVWIGNSLDSAEETYTFDTAQERILSRRKNRMAPMMPVADCVSGMKDIHAFTPARAQAELPAHAVLTAEGETITFVEVIDNPNLVERYVAQLTPAQMIRLSVCAHDGWGMDDTGVAGYLAQPNGLDIPHFVVSDGNSGVNVNAPNIGFPITAVMASSFDKVLLEKIGRVLGEEAREQQVDIILGPALNLHRNPLAGRQPEYFSEDPYLAGTLAGCYCKGLESTGVGGCYKHLICNNAETSRKRNQSILSERAIRELYFRAFDYAMEVHMPISVMTAYNAVNGLSTAADSDLLRGLLREECGFDGFVMTDWNSYDTCDPLDMLLGGNNWITPGSEDDRFTAPLEKAVVDGRLPLGTLQESVCHLLRAVALLKKRNV